MAVMMKPLRSNIVAHPSLDITTVAFRKNRNFIKVVRQKSTVGAFWQLLDCAIKAMKSVIGLSADAARTCRPFTSHKVELHPLNKAKAEQNFFNKLSLANFAAVRRNSILKDHQCYQHLWQEAHLYRG